jgi:DNA-binding transcriptional ArsR family regulator
MANYDMQSFMDLTRALGDENRVRVLLALEGGELCVCQIIELLNLAPSTVSKHMAILKHARLVDARKDGRWVYYSLAKEGTSAVQEAISWICRSLSNAPEIEADRVDLGRIVCLDPEALCQVQKERSEPGSGKDT